MKVKIDFANQSIFLKDCKVKPKFRPSQSVLRKLAKEITETIKGFVFENRLQVEKEVHSFKKFNALDRKNGEIIETPYKTVIKAGLYVNQPEVISIYNFRHGYNVFIVNNQKLAKQIENILLRNLS